MRARKTRRTDITAGGAMSVVECATWAGVGRTSIYKLIRTGQLRARKVLKRTVILKADAEECLGRQPLVIPNGGVCS